MVVFERRPILRVLLWYLPSDCSPSASDVGNESSAVTSGFAKVVEAAISSLECRLGLEA